MCVQGEQPGYTASCLPTYVSGNPQPETFCPVCSAGQEKTARSALNWLRHTAGDGHTPAMMRPQRMQCGRPPWRRTCASWSPPGSQEGSRAKRLCSDQMLQEEVEHRPPFTPGGAARLLITLGSWCRQLGTCQDFPMGSKALRSSGAELQQATRLRRNMPDSAGTVLALWRPLALLAGGLALSALRRSGGSLRLLTLGPQVAQRLTQPREAGHPPAQRVRKHDISKDEWQDAMERATGDGIICMRRFACISTNAYHRARRWPPH